LLKCYTQLVSSACSNSEAAPTCSTWSCLARLLQQWSHPLQPRPASDRCGRHFLPHPVYKVAAELDKKWSHIICICLFKLVFLRKNNKSESPKVKRKLITTLRLSVLLHSFFHIHTKIITILINTIVINIRSQKLNSCTTKQHYYSCAITIIIIIIIINTDLKYSLQIIIIIHAGFKLFSLITTITRASTYRKVVQNNSVE